MQYINKTIYNIYYIYEVDIYIYIYIYINKVFVVRCT